VADPGRYKRVTMSSRALLRLARLLLTVLVALAAFEAAGASTRILWRFAVLSWDNPATQLFDEMVCASSPPSQAGADAGQVTRLAVRPASRLVADSAPACPDSHALSSGITRSPPTA
jgi:hypothetical protein